MSRITFRVAAAAMVAVWVAGTAGASDAGDGTLTHVGDVVPDFRVQTLDGQDVSAASARGQVLVLDFFATWCGPCMVEMPDLQSKVYERFRGQPVIVLAIGREHTEAELRAFRESHPTLTLPMAADPARATYGKFATEFIPRTYVIGPDGKILYQESGYTIGNSGGAIAPIVAAITKAVAALGPATRPAGN